MHTTLCAFEDRAVAEQAREQLAGAGFARHDVHIEHRHATAEGDPHATDRVEDEGDRGPLEAFGHFFVSLFGRDNPSGHAYAHNVERGNYVVVVDARTEAEAQRAHALLQGLQAQDLSTVQRQDEHSLRDLVARRELPIGQVDRNRDRAMAASSPVVGARTGPDLRDPDLGHAPGLRYADKDKPA